MLNSPLPIAGRCLGNAIPSTTTLTQPPRNSGLDEWREWYEQSEKQPPGHPTIPPTTLPREFYEGENAGSEPPMDDLAFYRPAHSGHGAQYGIHIRRSGMNTLVDHINANFGGATLAQGDVLGAAALILYWHEACHGWIEDLVCLVDAAGRDPAIPTKIYSPRSNQFAIHVAAESLCNTAAFALLRKTAPSNAGLIEAVERFMRSQPVGYKDFDDSVTENPFRNEKFIDSLGVLLRLYQQRAPHPRGCYDDRWIARALEQYAGARKTDDLKHWRNRQWDDTVNWWRLAPPLFLDA